MKNHDYNTKTSDYFCSPFGVQLDGRTLERTMQVCLDQTTNTTEFAINNDFSSWGDWTAMGSAVLAYVSGEMQVTNPNNSTQVIGASKQFNVGEGLHNVNFDIIGNTCATIVLWPPSSTPKTINVYIRDNANNIVASGAYTTAGSYSLSFTPSGSGTYKIEFYMTNANAFCFFRVDNVLITYVDEVSTEVCNQVSSNYRYGFQAQEKDDEVSGKGNSYTAEFWQYDSRLGRRWNIDPVFKEQESPYACFANNPIWFIDPSGADTVKIGSTNDKTKAGDVIDWGGGEYSTMSALPDMEIKPDPVQLLYARINSIRESPEFKMRERLGIYGGTIISEANGITYEQVTSNTLVKYGSNVDYPEYKFIYPHDQGTWDTPGSDGLYWKGCMSCHSPRGAYNYAVYNSRERLEGIVAAAVFTEAVGGVISKGGNVSNLRMGLTTSPLQKAIIRTPLNKTVDGRYIDGFYFNRYRFQIHSHKINGQGPVPHINFGRDGKYHLFPDGNIIKQ